MKKAKIAIHQSDAFLPGFGLLVQVYDELLFESPDIIYDAAIVRMYMEQAVKLDVPLTVDCKTGVSWADCR